MREVRLKTRNDIRGIYDSCKIVAQLLVDIEVMIKPGISTLELDNWAEEYIRDRGAVPAFKGYRNFPATLCVSLNDEIVHGIPGDRKLKEGDLVTIDVGADLAGKFSDTARTYAVGNVDVEKKRLMETTKMSLKAGIDAIGNRSYISDIGRAIQSTIQSAGYKVVRDLTGHGVGFSQHEAPTIYNYPVEEENMRLRNGMVLAIEPMAAIGSEKIFCASDGWTLKTLDGSLSAHFEDTVAIWEGKVAVLTCLNDRLAEELFGGGVRS
ncbi:type I methionyl aminopeptidase [bacterium]|nr:type I methionyl aminopeptidase [bacterium]